jgi:hypothetical protein
MLVSVGDERELFVVSVVCTEVLKAVTLVKSALSDGVVDVGALEAPSDVVASEGTIEVTVAGDEADHAGVENMVETSDGSIVTPVASDVEAEVTEMDVPPVVSDIGAGNDEATDGISSLVEIVDTEDGPDDGVTMVVKVEGSV